MGYEEIRITDELDRAMQRAVKITPTGRAPLLAWESKSAAGYFLKLLRTLVGIRAAIAKIRIDSVWAGQPLHSPFGQIRRGRTNATKTDTRRLRMLLKNAVIYGAGDSFDRIVLN